MQNTGDARQHHCDAKRKSMALVLEIGFPKTLRVMFEQAIKNHLGLLLRVRAMVLAARRDAAAKPAADQVEVAV
jgi:hypothetical protein